MKIIAWGAVVYFSLMPLNALLQMVAKVVHHEPFVREDAIAVALGLFGVVVATTIYRIFIWKPTAKASRR